MAYRYNTTPEHIEQLKWVGECAICEKDLDADLDSRDHHIDHCHETGVIRGVLCSNCNKGLGHFKDNIESLTNAIKYLKRYE